MLAKLANVTHPPGFIPKTRLATCKQTLLVYFLRELSAATVANLDSIQGYQPTVLNNRFPSSHPVLSFHSEVWCQKRAENVKALLPPLAKQRRNAMTPRNCRYFLYFSGYSIAVHSIIKNETLMQRIQQIPFINKHEI